MAEIAQMMEMVGGLLGGGFGGGAEVKGFLETL